MLDILHLILKLNRRYNDNSFWSSFSENAEHCDSYNSAYQAKKGADPYSIQIAPARNIRIIVVVIKPFAAIAISTICR